jgi:hypothetical protein
MSRSAKRGYPGSEGSERLSIDQMMPLQEQCSGRALGIARGAKHATFEAVEDAIRGKETVATLVFCDDARGMASDFDDVGVGHDGSFAGRSGAPV